MIPQWIIEKKRDGQHLTEEEIRWFIAEYTHDRIPDYQMSALAMAIYFQGMSDEETAVLTDAMMHSGDLVDTSAITRPKVDKHSTGGIGDKVSLILAPLVACFDIAVPMISGRGLGITGGTLDKLESIPGYRTDLTENEFVQVIQECGCSITGQTGQLAPADKKLYALRDVTATVPSIPLITSSIMAKKMAEGIDALVLDVKHGSGAFMPDEQQARKLAESMIRVGQKMNKRVAALLTDMNQPLGRTAGNALEVIESLETLQGQGPEDLVHITIELSALMLLLTDRMSSLDKARDALRHTLSSGEAYDVFCRMAKAQGADIKALENPGQLPTASIKQPLPASTGGTITAADAGCIGRACLQLGAGRTATDGSVDPAVGVSDIRKVGERISAGDPLLILHANDSERLQQAEKLAADAYSIEDKPVTPVEAITALLMPEELS